VISVADWKPADGLVLEPNALLAAKEQARCLALTAGPGAGKTEMLAQRADFLLRTGECRYPKRILAISFKVDASKNLKDRVNNRCGWELASRFDSYTFHAFAKRIVDRFRLLLTGADALDPDYTIGDRKVARRQIAFGDLVPLAIRILQGSFIARNAVRQTYTDVFLDEFQDCTNLQYELVRIAFLGTSIRLTAVGDTKQKIMGWAGALDGIFATFAADFNAIPLNLYRNFRSKPRLLRLQNEIIKNLDPASVMPDDQLAGEDGEVFAWQFPSGIEEANYLADLIVNWVRVEGIPLFDVAVLVSKQLDLYANHLIKALEARGIPYRNEQSMQDITTEPVARLIVDYLSCLYGSREPKAWLRLVNYLMPFADDEVQSNTQHDFNRFIKDQRRALKATQTAAAPYADWWGQVRQFLDSVGLETIASLSPDYESKQRLREVISDTKNRIAELLSVEANLVKALERFSDDQVVRILTIHKSKGLEFDSVIILAVENEIFFGDQDSNRCAFFVAVSRAKKRLVLTHANSRERPEAFGGRWDINRTPQREYIGYALPFVK
jgi:superfamily I DNA/RNA helicase